MEATDFTELFLAEFVSESFGMVRVSSAETRIYIYFDEQNHLRS